MPALRCGDALPPAYRNKARQEQSKVGSVIAWKSNPVPSLPGGRNALSLYDTAVQDFVRPDVAGGASMYVCGITPYDATHMGHAATYVAFDLLNRYWRDAGLAVRYVQNVTDIDDPLLERANATNVDWEALAADQTELFRQDMMALNVLAPDQYIGAVESIEWIVPVVEDLLARGLAYPVPGGEGEPDGDIYFSVDAAARLPKDATPGWHLGVTSNLTEEQMLPLFAERGGDPQREGKRNRLDPLLWRVAREGEPKWDGASLGEGRPGWHIECSVIAQRFLPAPFTVQGGGSDLSFPHHEMSAGHAFAVSGTPLARHYAHAGMVGLDGEKMSKSKGNLVLVSKLRLSGVEPVAIRTAILGNHYRSDWSWTDEVLAAAQERVRTWREALPAASVKAGMDLLADVRSALAEDLNAPAALEAVDKWAANGGEAQEASADGRTLVAGTLDALLGLKL
jgi:L-cysteine:1D-myo-inositol 2-amino-2-deoxy-alpha-D-glucopyranoside ligase